jgi:hypothetical protein
MRFAKILDASEITSGIGRDSLFGCARERIDDASSLVANLMIGFDSIFVCSDI